jgi:hypothetical protein
MLDNDSREYIRHPSDIPLQYTLIDKLAHHTKSTHNVSLGGLSFSAHEDLKINSWLTITITVNKNEFQVEAQVRWCSANNNLSPESSVSALFDVGVQFSDSLDAFTIRMVEQICHIEHYKKAVLKEQGRELSNDEAAAEWIEKFAPKFPHYL